MGGGILSHGPLTVTESIITENTLDALNATGGGIFSDAALRIDGSIITRNLSGQGLDGRCGGVAAGGPMTTITRSTISRNSAGLAGGGLCIGGEGRIADSAITHNGSNVVFGAGGISSGADLTVINTTIANNNAAGISTGNTPLRIRSSTIVGNLGGSSIIVHRALSSPLCKIASWRSIFSTTAPVPSRRLGTTSLEIHGCA